MTDRERRHLRGPVHSVRTEYASWDVSTQSWATPERSEFVVFRPDGRLSSLESRSQRQVFSSSRRYDDGGKLIEVANWNDDGPKWLVRYRYDASGRLLESLSIDTNGARQQLATCAYDGNGRKSCVVMPGENALPVDEVDADSQAWQAFSFHTGEADAQPQTVTVLFDAADRPAEVLTHTATHELKARATFTRDRDGRMLTGELAYGSIEAFLGPKAAEKLEQASPEERLALERGLELAMDKQTFLSRTFAYDSAGRLIEKVERMGQLSEEATTFRYDVHGSESERVVSQRTRALDESGTFTPDERSELTSRSEYRYDGHGNWTERIWKTVDDQSPENDQSGIERRVITYHGGR